MQHNHSNQNRSLPCHTHPDDPLVISMTNMTASTSSRSTAPTGQRHIDWQYEPSDEEFIEAQLPAEGLADDALVGPLGAKAIASVTGAVSTILLSES
jgi:hypothetical protein